MRAEVDGGHALSRPHTPLLTTPNPLSGARSPRPDAFAPREDDEDHQKQWAREEQTMMMREQDRTMDTISGTLSTLAQQAGLMGQEIVEHNEYVDRMYLWLHSNEFVWQDVTRPRSWCRPHRY